MEKKLEVRNLRISFRTDAGKVQAVRGIDFDLYKGETLAIVGESGSGKSVTNKAIVGISAGNAIIESGEIIYDGQDLLQINEEDFHKLRGDKLSIIFQDPLSALDPINRIGMQMTEAMILKNRANRKNARRDFNNTMKYLLDYMNESMGVDPKSEKGLENLQKTKDFNTFEIEHLRIEGLYDFAKNNATEGLKTVNDLLFLIEKNAVTDFKQISKEVIQQAGGSVHENVCSEEILQYVNEFKEKLGSDYQELVPSLTNMKRLLEEGLAKPMPNFFALGYFNIFGKEELPNLPTEELNDFLRKYLDDNFMLAFIEDAKKAVIYSFNKSIETKKAVIEEIANKRYIFEKDVLDKKECKEEAKALSKLVNSTIDKLSTEKESVTYTFESAFSRALDTFFTAIPNNKKEQAIYDRATKKYNHIIERGRIPDYKVIPPKIIDTDIAKENILHRLDLIVEEYKKDIENVGAFDPDKATVALIDFFKEQAQKVAHVVTKSAAKTRALKLMEEVGIPNPRIRYRQFPFEFSGGMRQRIVIAIALSADPDILICDEPTTALDVTIQSQILELINRIKKERNLSVIFITHDLGVVANMADRVAVMYAGKIVEMGTSEDVFYDPRHPYTWALLSSMPDLDTKEKLDAIPGTPPNMIYPPKGDAFAARNKYAMEIDYELEPPIFKISDTHSAATWLLHEDAPKIKPPQSVLDRIERMKKKREEMEKKA